jgi:hypothetical protein
MFASDQYKTNHEVRKLVPQIYNNKACVVCNEAITNPICMHCLEEEMTSWFAVFDSSHIKEMKESSKILPSYGVTDVNCIRCGNTMDVCPHCYSKDVLMGLNNKMLADTFVETFNFDLRV